jgi:hypothetical protein
MLKSIKSVQDNLLPLLKKLIQKESYGVEVFLLTTFRDANRQFPIKEVYQLIQTEFQNKRDFHLSIIESKKMHTRGIITSYWYINPDTSLDFIFDGSISKKSNGNIYHGFLFNYSKLRLVKSVLKSIKEEIACNSVFMFTPGTKNVSQLTGENNFSFLTY